MELEVNIKNQKIKDELEQIFNYHSKSISCIYLFELGKVEFLREIFSVCDTIPNNYVIYKFGLTTELQRRSTEHIDYYGNLENVQIKLIKYTHINIYHLYGAEKDIRDFFVSNRMMLKINKNLDKGIIASHREIVCFNPLNINNIIYQLNLISDKYDKLLLSESFNKLHSLNTAIDKVNEFAHDTLKMVEKYKKINLSIKEEFGNDGESNKKVKINTKLNINTDNDDNIIYKNTNDENKIIDLQKNQCEYCGYVLSSTTNYKKHINSGICRPKVFNCKGCGKIFKKKQKLQYHVEQNVCGNASSEWCIKDQN